jgi:hypothetical protein
VKRLHASTCCSHTSYAPRRRGTGRPWSSSGLRRSVNRPAIGSWW